MKRDNINYFLVGLFVLGMGAVFLYALYRITGQDAQGEPYLTYFPNVAGIKTGSVVTFEGFEVGNVGAIKPVSREGRTHYQVTLNLRQPLSIPVDSRALIASPGLLGAPLVEIREGQSTEHLPPGGSIASAANANLMASMTNLASDLSGIAETGLKPLLAQVGLYVGTLGQQLDDNVPAAMADLRATLARLNSAAGRIDELFGDPNRKHLGNVLRNADAASEQVRILAADLHRVRDELEALARDARTVVDRGGDEVETTLVEVRESLRRTNALLHQLESAGRNLNEFSRNIRHNPSSLISSRPPAEATGDAR
jgi:phospholipid/cholesterol/gamma-HCH transport system substrate-binding protein